MTVLSYFVKMELDTAALLDARGRSGGVSRAVCLRGMRMEGGRVDELSSGKMAAPIQLSYGLSPRVRGNRTPRPTGAEVQRSIPACAGEPGSPPWSSTSQRVYPRVCGGTSSGLGVVLCVPGLSPRVRGNLVRLLLMMMMHRSIPACAGEPIAFSGWLVVPEVCPRVCEGTGVANSHSSSPVGLSPRVRGNRQTE